MSLDSTIARIKSEMNGGEVLYAKDIAKYLSLNVRTVREKARLGNLSFDTLKMVDGVVAASVESVARFLTNTPAATQVEAPESRAKKIKNNSLKPSRVNSRQFGKPLGSDIPLDPVMLAASFKMVSAFYGEIAMELENILLTDQGNDSTGNPIL